LIANGGSFPNELSLICTYILQGALLVTDKNQAQAAIDFDVS